METVVRHDLPALLHLVDSGQVAVSDKTGLATAASLRKLGYIFPERGLADDLLEGSDLSGKMSLDEMISLIRQGESG